MMTLISVATSHVYYSIVKVPTWIIIKSNSRYNIDRHFIPRGYLNV